MKKNQIYQVNKNGITPTFIDVGETYFVSDNDFVTLAVNGDLRDELLGSLNKPAIYVSRIGVFDESSSSYLSYLDDYKDSLKSKLGLCALGGVN